MPKNPISTSNPFKNMFRGNRAKILKGMHRPEGAGNFDGADDTGLFKDIKIKGTKGSVLFHDGDLITQDNANFFWDDTNNRLGIGTTSPNHTLSLLKLTGNNLIEFKTQSVGTASLIGVSNDADNPINGMVDGDLGIRMQNNANIFFSTSGSTGKDLMIKNGVGVGIGTTSPNEKLEISAVDTTTIRLNATDTSLTTNQVVGKIAFFSNDASAFGTGEKVFIQGIITNSGGNQTALVFATSTSNSTVGVEAMRIDKDGRLGIGTTSPICDLDVDGGFAANLVSKTGAYTATTSDHTILCGSGNESFTVTLPAASGVSGIIYNIKNIGTGTITIDGNASETIDGATTAVITAQFASISIQCDGSNWHII